MEMKGIKEAETILEAAIKCNLYRDTARDGHAKMAVAAMVIFTVDVNGYAVNVETEIIPFAEIPENVKHDPYYCQNGWNYVTAYMWTNASLSTALNDAMRSRKTWLATVSAGDAIEKPKRTPEEYMDIAVKNLGDRANSI